MPAVGSGSLLHAYGAHGMPHHILLRQYRQNYSTYNSVVKIVDATKMQVSQFEWGIF